MDWETFADHLVGQGLNSKTVRIYLRHVQAADDWLRREKRTNLAKARAIDVAEYCSENVPASHSSRGQAAAAFRHYWDMVERVNAPRKAVRVPPQPEMVCRALSGDDARALAKTALGWYPKGTAVLAGLYLALRVSEIASMEWDRFESDLGWYRVTGKFDKTATLPVHPILRAELEFLPRSSQYVFPGRKGLRAHVAPATVWSWTKQVSAAAGLGPMTTHWLRHTSLTVANDNTGDLRAVQSFARHSNPAQTAGYTRTKAQRLTEVVNSLDYLGLRVLPVLWFGQRLLT